MANACRKCYLAEGLSSSPPDPKSKPTARDKPLEPFLTLSKLDDPKKAWIIKTKPEPEKPLALLSRAVTALESDLNVELRGYIFYNHLGSKPWRLAANGKRVDIYTKGSDGTSPFDLSEYFHDEKLDIAEGKTVTMVTLSGSDIGPVYHLILRKKMRLPDEEPSDKGDGEEEEDEEEEDEVEGDDYAEAEKDYVEWKKEKQKRRGEEALKFLKDIKDVRAGKAPEEAATPEEEEDEVEGDDYAEVEKDYAEWKKEKQKRRGEEALKFFKDFRAGKAPEEAVTPKPKASKDDDPKPKASKASKDNEGKGKGKTTLKRTEKPKHEAEEDGGGGGADGNGVKRTKSARLKPFAYWP